MKKTVAACLFFVALQSLFSQQFYDFGFERNSAIVVKDSNLRPLASAWAGGINSVYCSEIDLDLDGQMDLFLFEKNGNRILPFINQSADNQIVMTYAPHYRHAFPKLHDWALLKDFNGDGKMDIFTYGLAGISVYKNVSVNELRFELVTEQLTSNYYGNEVNIFASPDDYCAIEDMDGDGDLDLLNFMVLGKFVHYQRNYAMEHHGTAEILDFRLEDECWGNFAEGAEDNTIVLHTDCGQDGGKPARHVGSSILAYPFHNQDVNDIILGDVDYPTLLLLENGGTPAEPEIVRVTADFPTAAQPISLYSMPVANFIDLDFDGLTELLSSPSDPSFTKSQNLNSLWLYKKESQSADYQLVTKSFLQDEMIDVGGGAYPIFYDWNGDGLQDLFVANYGSYDTSLMENFFLTSFYHSSIAYFQNVGDSYLPEFQLVTSDFGNLKRHALQALYPAFGDFDGNGTIDLLCGNKNGDLLHFSNRNAPGVLPDFDEPRPFSDISVGGYSTPQYFDLDGDGYNDLLIGNRRGNIAYYRANPSSQRPDFQLVTDVLGGVDVRNHNLSSFGYAVPCFFKNQHNEMVLFCGSEQGSVFYYNDIDGNLEGNFSLQPLTFAEAGGAQHFPFGEGARAGVAVANLNGDGFPDLVVGNYAGGLSYFGGVASSEVQVSVNQQVTDFCWSVFPNPASHFITISCPDGILQKVDLYDFMGRHLTSSSIQNRRGTLDISSFSSGIYFLKITTNWGEKTKKIVKL